MQIARQMSPAFKKSSIAGRAAFGESMRRALLAMKADSGQSREGDGANWSQHLNELEAEIGALEEQSRSGRKVVGSLATSPRRSISSHASPTVCSAACSTPAWSRWRRCSIASGDVMHDISLELKKKVNLEIKGEKTELDKRMIDELGDPLIHLVRNSIDHGIELAKVPRSPRQTRNWQHLPRSGPQRQ